MTTLLASLLFPLLLLFSAASGSRQRENGIIAADSEHAAWHKVPGHPEQDNLMQFWVAATGIYIAACLVIVGLWTQLIVPREKEALDSIEDDEEETGATALDFGDPSLDYRNRSNLQQKQRKRFKQQWLRENSADNISLGASTLFMACCVLIVYRFIRLVEQPRKMQTLWGLLFCEFAFLFASAGVSFRCIRHPKEMYYWPTLLASMFYTLFMHLPPLIWSCTDLMKKYADDSHWYVQQALHNDDCSTQGSTAQQVLMTWMLMTPWLIPRFKMMYLLWPMVAVYFIVSLLYRKLLEQEPEEAEGKHKGVLSAFSVGSSVFYMGVALVVATGKKFYLEKSQRNKFVNVQQRQQASGKLYEILEYMVPAHVIIPMLKSPGSVISEYVDCASILFIVIEDFDRFASTKTPEDLLIFLNEQFSRIDEICAENGVTKIETVGEEYVACVGVVPADRAKSQIEGHGAILERLFRAAEQILALQTDEVQFKMGLHTGPVKAGVIGHKLPRYRLFGDVINTAARMMQKSSPGKLQLSEETAVYCRDRASVKVKDIGLIEMKGKGMVQAYHFESIAASSTYRMLARSTTSRRTDDSVRARLLNRMPLVSGLLKGGGPADAFDSEDAEDAEDQKFGRERLDFKTILKQMEEGSGEKTNYILSEKKGFTPEMEQDWYMWFHTNTICKKLAARLDRQTIAVSLLTIVEALYISQVKTVGEQSRLDLTKFLACRLTIVLIMIALRALAGSTQWIHRNAFGGQTLLLITSIVTSGIFFASYDAMAMPSQKFNLSFMLVYFLASRQYNMLFYPSLVFVAFAVVLMMRVEVDAEAMAGHSDENGDGHLYYSWMGQGLFVALSFSNAVVAHDEEQSSRLRYKALKAVELTQDRIDRILRTLMPPLVVQQIRPGEPHQSHHYKLATIAQSDLCGFTKLASTKTPAEVVGFISDLFGLFDLLTDEHKVYKIETVGDAYIAGMANQPLTEHNSPFSVLLFGLDMVVKTNEWASKLGVNVTCRVGVHHGECTGGIVGNDMQRYHLFGELLTSLDILESTSVEGRVQVSLKAKEAVEAQMALTTPDFQAPTADLLRRVVMFERRADPQLVTSKGETHEYNKVGGITFLVREQPGK